MPQSKPKATNKVEAVKEKIVEPAREVISFTPQPKQQLFLSSQADLTIFGGAAGGGKSYALLLEPIYHVENEKFGAIIFRRTYPQITQEGGLWETSQQIYPYLGAKAVEGDLKWTFPQGSTVIFKHLENESTKYEWDGSQIPLICFDQLESFTEGQFWYMFSRNRSTCGVKPYVRATCNPKPGWLSRFLSWWVDEKTGYAIPERSGRTRWFCRIADGLKWADTREELTNRYPDSMPKSVCFILSKLTDNQALMSKDPGYMANLLALPMVERERLLGGNWKIAIAGNIFRPEWWKIIDDVPSDIISEARAWDLAATPEETGNDPDWTAGVKLARTSQGQIIICDVVRFRGTPLTNEIKIASTANLDGVAVPIGMEEEGGASGKSLLSHYARNVLFGYTLTPLKARVNKILRWSALSSAAEKGNVFLKRAKWNQDFIDELAGCKGEDEKNDSCDAASAALEMLTMATGAIGPDDIKGMYTGTQYQGGGFTPRKWGVRHWKGS